MEGRPIEATNGPHHNHGKFLVQRFTDEEWAVRSVVDGGTGLIAGRGWHRRHVLVLDLQTGEGGLFQLGGLASADLNKRRIWVCPLFEPFLAWLYDHYRADPDRWWGTLPGKVDLTGAEFAFFGYRRGGPGAGGVIEVLRRYYHDEQGPYTGHSTDRDSCRECSAPVEALAAAGLIVVPALQLAEMEARERFAADRIAALEAKLAAARPAPEPKEQP